MSVILDGSGGSLGVFDRYVMEDQRRVPDRATGTTYPKGGKLAAVELF